MPRHVPWLLPLVAALGCAGRLGPATEAFEHARYPEARRALQRLEPELAEMSPVELARYSLQRGLTELALGNAREAHRWLGAARRVAAYHPETLSARERERLGAAWSSLGLMPGEEAPPEAAPREAAPR
ncbi:MAG: hypothetical protein IT376_07755 [Polyangiaceae bacterium]|nr:hypothetical protein [Polyangiaceae bacterium]